AGHWPPWAGHGRSSLSRTSPRWPPSPTIRLAWPRRRSTAAQWHSPPVWTRLVGWSSSLACCPASRAARRREATPRSFWLWLAGAGGASGDCVGAEVMGAGREGQSIRVDGGEVWIGPNLVATGIRQTPNSVEHDYEMAKRRLGEELGRFAVNTLEYLREEHNSFLDSLDVPVLRTSMAGRQVLIVVRGRDYKSDLAALRPYVREMRPVLVAVDGGADALLDVGLRPDVIIGDFDSVSEPALDTG